MKSAIIATFLLLSVCTAHAALDIEDTWIEYDYLYVLATWSNDTTDEYAQVMVKCKALDDNGKVINQNSRGFHAWRIGKIGSGFSDTVKIPIKLRGKSCDSISCVVATMDI